MEELTFFYDGYFTDFFESGYKKLVCYHKNITYEFHILGIWKTKHHVNTVGKSKATITHTTSISFYQRTNVMVLQIFTGFSQHKE